MKRNSIAIVMLFILAGGVSAQPYSLPKGNVLPRQVREGISAGDNMFSIMMGGGLPRGDSGVKLDENGQSLDWGKPGPSYGLSFMYFVADYVGLGVEIGGMMNREASASFSLDYWPYRAEGKVKTSMRLFNAMATARININPHAKVRLYLPFGGGLASARGKVRILGEVNNIYSFRETYSETTQSFGYFVGLGMEANVGEDGWSLGGELRYSGFDFDLGKLEVDEGKKKYKYLAILLKASYRF